MNIQPRLIVETDASYAPWAAAGRLRVERHEDLAAIEAEWRQLETCGVGTVFQRYDWAASYARHVLPHEGATPAVILGRLDGRPGFILPIAIRSHGPARCAEWIGGAHAGYNFGLWSPEAAAVVAAMERNSLMRLFADALRGVDCAVLERMPREHDGMWQPLAALPHMPSASEGYSFSLNADFDELLSTRGGGARKRKIRYKERKMKAVGALAAGTVRDFDQAEAALDFFAREKPLRLAEQGKSNSFGQPGVMDFFHDLLVRSAGKQEPLLEMSRLSVGGTTRAVIGSGIFNGRINIYFMTYVHDELMAQSPGQVLTFHHIEECCARGLADYDLGIGYEQYKETWCDETHALDDAYVGFTPLGRATVAAFRGTEAAKNRLRQHRELWSRLKTMRARLASELAGSGE